MTGGLPLSRMLRSVQFRHEKRPKKSFAPDRYHPDRPGKRYLRNRVAARTVRKREDALDDEPMIEDISIPPVREDGLQLQEERRIQRVFWTVQRVSWFLFGVVCLVALLGFTGSGGVFQKQTVYFADAVVE